MWSLFLFKQKTAYDMRIGDWSSDVCSSDLPTVTRTSGPTFLNSSATASVIGYTVLEPSIVISPERPSEDRFPPQEITVSAKNAKRMNWICFMTGLYICGQRYSLMVRNLLIEC